MVEALVGFFVGIFIILIIMVRTVDKLYKEIDNYQNHILALQDKVLEYQLERISILTYILEKEKEMDNGL